MSDSTSPVKSATTPTVSSTWLQTAIDYTPSTAIQNGIDAAVKGAKKRSGAAAVNDSFVPSSVGQAAWQGAGKGLNAARALGMSAFVGTAAYKGAVTLPVLGTSVFRAATFAGAADIATQAIDAYVVKTLDVGDKGQSRGNASKALGWAVKIASLFFLEVPRLTFKAVHVGAAVVCAAAGALAYVLKHGVNKLFANKEVGAKVEEAAKETKELATEAAEKAAEKTEELAGKTADQAEKIGEQINTASAPSQPSPAAAPVAAPLATESTAGEAPAQNDVEAGPATSPIRTTTEFSNANLPTVDGGEKNKDVPELSLGDVGAAPEQGDNLKKTEDQAA